MDLVPDFGDITSYIDHTQPYLMISESIFTLTWIFRDFDIIGAVVPEPSQFASLGIIRAICCEIDCTSESIAVHLIVSDLFMIALHLTIILEYSDRRIRIREGCNRRQSSDIGNDWWQDILDDF